MVIYEKDIVQMLDAIQNADYKSSLSQIIFPVAQMLQKKLTEQLLLVENLPLIYVVYNCISTLNCARIIKIFYRRLKFSDNNQIITI